MPKTKKTKDQGPANTIGQNEVISTVASDTQTDWNLIMTKKSEDIAATVLSGLKDSAASLLMMEDAAKEARTDRETASGQFTRLYFHAVHIKLTDDVQAAFGDGQWKRLKGYASHGKYLYDQIRGDGRVNVANPDSKKAIIIGGNVIRVVSADHIMDLISPKAGDSGIRTIANAVRKAIKEKEERNAARTDATDKAIAAWIRHGTDDAAEEARTDGEDVATVKAYRAADLSRIIADGNAIIEREDAAKKDAADAAKEEARIADAVAIIATASTATLARILAAMERRAADDAMATATAEANRHAAEGVAGAADRLFAVAS